MKKLRIAVTGGIASGKSFFCSELSRRGLPFLNLDKEVDCLYRDNEDFCVGLVELLGSDILFDSGLINKQRVANLVFQNPFLLAELQKRVYFFLKEELFLFQKSYNLSLVEVPLLYEESWEKYFDYVVLIVSDRKIRIKRCLDRGLSKEETLLRMSYQWSDELKKDKVDEIFYNSNNINDLRRQCDLLWTKIFSMME